MALGITDPQLVSPSTSLQLVTYFIGGTSAYSTAPRPANVLKTGLPTQHFTVDMAGRFFYYVDGSGNLMRWDSASPAATDIQLQSHAQIGDTLTWLEMSLDNSAIYAIGAANKLYKVLTSAPYTTSVLAGSGGQGNADGTGTNATFHALHTLFVDQSSGVIYTYDDTTGALRSIAPDTGAVTTIASGIGIPPGNLLKSKSGKFFILSNESMTAWSAASGSQNINLISGNYTNPGTIDDGEPGSYFIYFLAGANSQEFKSVYRYEIATGAITTVATLSYPGATSDYNEGSRLIYRTPALYLVDTQGNLIQIQG